MMKKGFAKAFIVFFAAFILFVLGVIYFSVSPPRIKQNIPFMSRQLQKKEATISGLEEASEASESAECIVTGCSGQVCAEEEVMTTCEFLPEYECYKAAVCERQVDGGCGWSETMELKECLEEARKR